MISYAVYINVIFPLNSFEVNKNLSIHKEIGHLILGGKELVYLDNNNIQELIGKWRNTIHHLSLYNNLLKTLDFTLFSKESIIHYLDVSNNNINSIKGNIPQNLFILEANNNNITKFHLDINNNLRKLDLRNNPLEKITGFINDKKLKIKLSNCESIDIPNNMLKHVTCHKD